MKTMFKNTIVVLSFLLFFVGCVPEETAVPELKCTQPDIAVTATVAKVLAQTTATATQYQYDDVVEAYVVSSDEGGNFFKSISFQTLATANTAAQGFSIPIDVSNLYIEYRVGTKVYVKLKDLYTDLYFGGLRIGGLYVNAFNQGGVGRLSQNDYKKIVNASCTQLQEEALVRKMSLQEVFNDANLNTLIEIKDVQFAEEAIGRSFFEETNNVGGASNWNIVDKSGNQLYVRTSSFADFAAQKIPEGNGTVRGILTKFGDDYQLLPRSTKDIVMTGNRAIPFFNQDFKTVADRSIISLPGWANIVQNGSLAWRGGVSSGNGYAEFYFSGTRVLNNTAWLISPKIDMDVYTNEILTFRAAQHHLDVDSPLNALEVYVSSNFNGLNVTTATWTRLNPKLPTQATPWNLFIGSGPIDLSAYKGKINIAFKFVGSGRNLALDGSFMVDDVQLYGEK